MIIKSSTLFVQLILTILIIMLFSVNIVPAWLSYQQKIALTSENPTGANLAERYLISGNWPASKENNSAIKQYRQYVMESDK